MKQEKNIKERLKDVKAFVFDVDGVLSTSHIPLYPGGEPMRVINTKDGYALHQASVRNYPLAIITGGRTDAIEARFRGLGFHEIYMGAKNKIGKLKEFAEKYNLKMEEIMYMGDDIPDYECMKMVGFPVCPSDAVPEIKEISVYISDREGGRGCARDVVEQVLKAQGQWMSDVEAFGW
ncbi:MAG: HAD hydrolase family protein [Paludibacteraceae bacterium]|nr:HAD hydrolase family protein [Paludibacteraceae bacterium]MBO7337889.1 HAD hydrolase family protein [Paludibacteraceae bacterium]MBP5137095.1 HAD hydrolase family protein [Paludibacteraceae bacterium]MBP5742398.1 HAD hydrolase family protein [Paludibacteraceae bacterium]